MNIASLIDKLSLFNWIILGTYFFFFVTQLFYYLYLFRKPYKQFSIKGKEDIDEINIDALPGISIIITAENEAENLLENLPYVLEQDYPNFQVVVVNNASTDTTDIVLSGLSHTYPNLYTTYIPIESELANNKKLALTLGVKAAKHDILLFTEADSKPLSKKWVYEYAKEFIKGSDIVLGCCQLKFNKGLFQKYMRFDNMSFGINYLSMALAKKPYMGIGRNMAYRKDLFFKKKGFSSIINIDYGEDNLFINQIANEKNTSVVLSPQSLVESNVVNKLATWRKIKSKYLITQKHLSGFKTQILGFEVFSRYVFYISFAILIVTGVFSYLNVFIWIAVILFLIRYAVQLSILNKNSKIYNAGKFYLSIFVFDLTAPIFNYNYLRYERLRNRK
ncbi:MAG: glycosyltransferase [Dysgonamonadaceae bacterium]|nr:glycosyltransferase [Dysgonamonadaceae bacterium]MDD4728586.1 glycosyltransferase [Dysgonamonadaceae bacterium]